MMMGPSFERIVGKVPESEKEKIFIEGRDRFDNQEFDELLNLERKKTEEEKQIILLANEETNKIREEYGLDNFDIPLKNIHIIKQDKWPRGKSRGVFKTAMQGVAVVERSERSVLLEVVLHELFHFKSYSALHVFGEENFKTDEYRLGLCAHTRDNKQLYFSNLNEGVTEELTKRSTTELFKHPLFKEEMEQTKETIIKNPGAIAQEDGRPLFNEDTFYAREEDGAIFTDRYTYKEAREILNILIDKLFEQNKDKFQKREDIFEIFVAGMMTGNLLSVGRLVDGTFGRGTLRKIGELDQEIKEQKEFVNSL